MKEDTKLVNPVIELSNITKLYSPFSGQLAEKEGEPNTNDHSLLFIYIGDVDEFSFINNRFTEYTHNIESDIDEKIQQLEIEGLTVFKVNNDWNGIVYYAFAPDITHN